MVATRNVANTALLGGQRRDMMSLQDPSQPKFPFSKTKLTTLTQSRGSLVLFSNCKLGQRSWPSHFHIQDLGGPGELTEQASSLRPSGLHFPLCHYLFIVLSVLYDFQCLNHSLPSPSLLDSSASKRYQPHKPRTVAQNSQVTALGRVGRAILEKWNPTN